MKAIEITWKVLLALATVIIAVLLLGAGDTKFEKVALASLVEIYAALRGMGLGLVLTFIANEEINFARFVEFATLLKHEEASEYVRSMQETTELAQSRKSWLYIEVWVTAAISIAALARLLFALL